MRCEYIVTLQDFTQSVKAYRAVSKRARFVYVAIVWVLPAILASCGLLLLMPAALGREPFFSWTSFPAIVFIAAAIAFPARQRDAILRAFKLRNHLAQNRPVECVFDPEKVRFIVPGGTEVSYPWHAFTRYRTGQTVLTLFVGEAAFHTIPMRAMNADGWKNFHAMLTQNSEAKPC